MSDTPTTLRWVATDRSAGQAASAFFRLTLRRRTWWALVATVELLLAFLIASSIDDRYGMVSRLAWGSVYALVPTFVFCGICISAAYLLNRRMFGRRLKNGVVLEAAIGEDHLVLSGPFVESRVSFDGVASVRPSGDWVFLQLVGSPLQTAWPAPLFPRDDLGRLQRSVSTRRP